jgi:hypothetical protein
MNYIKINSRIWYKLLSSYQPSKIHTISSYIYELISNHVRNTLYMYYMKPNLSVTWCLDVAVMDRNKTFCSTACQVRFHTHFRVRGMLIIEDPTVIMKCRTAIKALFFHFNVCLSVKLDVPELLIVCNKYKCLFIVRNEMDVNELQLYTWSKN